MARSSKSITVDVARLLGNYVYALVDPNDGIPFYIGKGTTSRVEHHGLEARAWLKDENPEGINAKLDRINAIEASGDEVDIWILRYGMTDKEYSVVESTLIDFIRTFPITASPTRVRPLATGVPLANKVRGQQAAKGITRLSDIVDGLRAPALSVEHPLLLVTLNDWVDSEERMPDGRMRLGYGFKNEWLDKTILDSEIDQLANSVCCWWHWGIDRIEKTGITHLVAVYRGVTRGLFEIEADSHRKLSPTRKGCTVTPVVDKDDRLWQEVVGPSGHLIPPKKRGEQGTFRYWPYD